MSDPADNVVELAAQMTFEGTAVTGITDTLRSMKSQPSPRSRKHFEHVTGWFKGRVVDIRSPEKGEGSVERQQIIEVLEWGTD